MEDDKLVTYGEAILGGMIMNWLLIVVLAILIIYALNGRRRGLIKTVFTMFSTIVALLLTSWISPVVSKELQKNERVVSVISENVEKIVDFSNLGNKTSDQVNFIDKLNIPKNMRTSLLEHNTTDMYVAMAVDNFNEYVVNYITRIIINAFVYIIIMILVTIALTIISGTLNIISKLPIINGLNKSAGLLAGFAHGIIVIWIGCIVITIFSSTEFGQNLFDQINNSVILSTIYNNNVLLNIITNVGKMLF